MKTSFLQIFVNNLMYPTPIFFGNFEKKKNRFVGSHIEENI